MVYKEAVMAPSSVDVVSCNLKEELLDSQSLVEIRGMLRLATAIVTQQAGGLTYACSYTNF
jgi:hypothetical protein